MYSTDNRPQILVFAGPNGSGKSTVTNFQNIVGEYINADKIKSAKGCSDLEAAQEAEKLREYLLRNRLDYTFETVLSTPRNLLLLQRAQTMGYHIRAIFVLTRDSAINIQRVKNRVSKGGHDVPEEKIVSRYNKSLENIKSLYKVVDELFIYDNSGESPILICTVRNRRLEYFENDQWSRDAVLALF